MAYMLAVGICSICIARRAFHVARRPLTPVVTETSLGLVEEMSQYERAGSKKKKTNFLAHSAPKSLCLVPM